MTSLKTKLIAAWTALISGLLWSVTYLAVVAAVAGVVGAKEALVISWPLKIAWSTLHTAWSRWRGAKTVRLTIATA